MTATNGVSLLELLKTLLNSGRRSSWSESGNATANLSWTSTVKQFQYPGLEARWSNNLQNAAVEFLLPRTTVIGQSRIAGDEQMGIWIGEAFRSTYHLEDLEDKGGHSSHYELIWTIDD